MAAVKPKGGRMISGMGSKDALRQAQGDDLESSDDDRGSESDMSEASGSVGSDEGSVEDNDNDATEEMSDEEGVSDDDVSSSGDDNAEGQEWMDVDDVESDDQHLSSSDDDESSNTPLQSKMELSNVDPKLHGNEGWADAMAKILRTSKPKGKKTIVLAKAKKLSQVAAQVAATQEAQSIAEDYGFEIDGQAEDDVKPKVEELDVKPVLPNDKPKVRRKDLLAEGKVKPTLLDRERERALSKIATKGVVQLFNAVRQQQKDISSKIKEAKGSIRKEEKVIKSIDKRAFLDVLMGNSVSEKVQDNIRSKAEKDEIKDEKPDQPATWSVLRDNFLTGSNLKDWDKSGEVKIEDDADVVELS